MYITPKSSDGEIAVAICSREEVLEQMIRGEDWNRYACPLGQANAEVVSMLHLFLYESRYATLS
jgi:hypothetical protein